MILITENAKLDITRITRSNVLRATFLVGIFEVSHEPQIYALLGLVIVAEMATVVAKLDLVNNSIS